MRATGRPGPVCEAKVVARMLSRRDQLRADLLTLRVTEILSAMVDEGLIERGPLNQFGEPTFVLREAGSAHLEGRLQSDVW